MPHIITKTDLLEQWLKSHKEKYIQRYICNFMATYDANRMVFLGDEVYLDRPCKYELAKREAERAWLVVEQGVRKETEGM